MSSGDLCSTARIFEVGPRDGLQNEKVLLALEDKVWLIDALARAGICEMEAGALVRPDRVPPMAESEAVFLEAKRRSVPADLYFLVPNEKGLERAIQAGIQRIAVFTAASEEFNQRNIGMGVRESIQRIAGMVATARHHQMTVRAYVSTVWGCPFQGRIDPGQALPIVEALLALPVSQVSIGDTIGVASSNGVKAILGNFNRSESLSRLAVHFHDTRGTALVNAATAFDLGIRTFDSSIGGLGGCPFAPGASGNLATEDLAYFFKENGVSTGLHYEILCETSLELARRMGRSTLSSRALQAYQANCTKNRTWDF